MRVWLPLSLMLSLPPWTAVAAQVSADEPDTTPPTAHEPSQDARTLTARDVEARVEALARLAALDDTVKRPLAIAQRALERARARGRSSDRDARADAARSEQLALAAITLAEARLRLVRERALLRAAESRRREAERDLASQAAPRALAPASTPP